LDVVVIVVGASVLAAHHINFIEAFGIAADAFELEKWSVDDETDGE
jgi:hypothetical protein